MQVKPSRTLWGSWAPGGPFNQLLIREGRSSQETIVLPWDRTQVLSQEIHIMSLSSSAELKPPTEQKMFQREGHSLITMRSSSGDRHKEAEIEWFYEDLQDLLELKSKKDVLFIIGKWNAKVGSQEIPGVTGKFGLGVQNEAGQRLMGFCQENALVIANTLFQQHREAPAALRDLFRTWCRPPRRC